MSTTQELRDLIETRSAQHSVVRLKLWEWAFTAILKDMLIFELPNDVAPDPQFDYASRLRTSIIGALPNIKEGYGDPSKWNWVRMLMISPKAFDKWLKGALRSHQFPPLPKRRAGAKSTPRDKLKEFIDDKWPDGVPPGITREEIARLATGAVGRKVDVRTVTRARGGK